MYTTLHSVAMLSVSKASCLVVSTAFGCHGGSCHMQLVIPYAVHEAPLTRRWAGLVAFAHSRQPQDERPFCDDGPRTSVAANASRPRFESRTPYRLGPTANSGGRSFLFAAFLSSNQTRHAYCEQTLVCC